MWRGEIISLINKIMSEVNVRISFPNVSKGQMEHITNAEKELGKAGIVFDTGFDLKENRRDWEFDPAEGVEVHLKANK